MAMAMQSWNHRALVKFSWPDISEWYKHGTICNSHCTADIFSAPPTGVIKRDDRSRFESLPKILSSRPSDSIRRYTRYFRNSPYTIALAVIFLLLAILSHVVLSLTIEKNVRQQLNSIDTPLSIAKKETKPSDCRHFMEPESNWVTVMITVSILVRRRLSTKASFWNYQRL